MIENVKPVDSLQVADLQAHPVWQYTNREGVDETFVRPVKRLPVDCLDNMVVGTQVILANGKRVWATICNVDSTDAKVNEHFLTLSIERNGRWFTLARYHDFDYTDRGPAALAQFLGLSVDQVFPIAYDIQQYAKGSVTALSRHVQKEPREQLSQDELMAMAVR